VPIRLPVIKPSRKPLMNRPSRLLTIFSSKVLTSTNAIPIRRPAKSRRKPNGWRGNMLNPGPRGLGIRTPEGALEDSLDDSADLCGRVNT
jgi:hypothetical protein